MNIVLFGNNLAAVNALRVLNNSSHDVRVVVPAKKIVHDWHESLYDYAKNNHIEFVYDAENINNPLFIEEMRLFEPDVFLSIYYDQILGDELLEIPKIASINVHPSLLPKYRGTAPIIWSVVNGESKTGVSFHYMEKTVDAGDILLQQEVPIRRNDTGFSVHMKCAEMVKSMMPKFLQLLDSNNLIATPQIGKGSVYKKSDGNLNLINWSDSAQKIHNIVRALTKPLNGAYTILKDQKCFVWSVRENSDDCGINGLAPGNILIRDNRLLVGTGDNCLEIMEVGIGGLHLSCGELVQKLSLVEGDSLGAAPEALVKESSAAPSENFIPFGLPLIGEEEIEEVVDTLRSGWIGMGNKTMLFEDSFRDYVGAKHAIAVSSCTAALHLSLWANELGPGDEVITTGFTFAATVTAILMTGATPVLADIDPHTLNIDVIKIAAQINPKTKAIIPVHFGGLPCDMEAINSLAAAHDLLIIEDAAHAIGAEYGSSKIGDGANFACFSFYPNKNMTTCEGGMVTTNNDELADKIRSMRIHGLQGHAWKRFLSKEIMFSSVVLPGYKYNMTDMQASLGIHQIKKVGKWLAIRESYAQTYDSALQGLSGFALQPRTGKTTVRHGLHLYVVLIDESRFSGTRNDFVVECRERNIGAAIHYPAIHTHPYLKDKVVMDGESCRISRSSGERIFSLPLAPAMSIEQIHYIASEMKSIHEKFYIG